GARLMTIDGDMIRMPVAASFIEGYHHLWAKLANDRDELPHYLGSAGLCKCAWILVLRRTSHTRIAVVQKPQIVHAQHLSRCPHFTRAYLAQIFRRCQCRIGNLANLTSRGTYQACLNARRAILQYSSAHHSFIVRMSKCPK